MPGKEKIIRYKNCKIWLYRESEIWYFSIIDLKDGFEFCSSYSESMDTLQEMISSLKNIIDDYLQNPEEFE